MLLCAYMHHVYSVALSEEISGLYLPCSPNQNADASQGFKPHLGNLPGPVDIGYLSGAPIFSFLLTAVWNCRNSSTNNKRH